MSKRGGAVTEPWGTGPGATEAEACRGSTAPLEIPRQECIPAWHGSDPAELGAAPSFPQVGSWVAGVSGATEWEPLTPVPCPVFRRTEGHSSPSAC